MDPNVNPQSNTQTKRIGLTTKTLGIAGSKEKDLAGYVLSQRDIVNAATKILLAVGLNEEDIRTIKVGSDINTKQLRIICEVKYKAAFGKSEKEHRKWNEFTDYGEEKKTAFNGQFYSALYNKVYHGNGKKKHLKVDVVSRRDKNGKTKKYARFEFDPYIFIAFVYDIVFTDSIYRISAPPVRWKSDKEVNDLDGNKRRKYKSIKAEYKMDNLSNCAIYVTFSANAKWEGVITDADGNEKKVKYTGFHPSQVDEFYGDTKKNK